ncbi:MAG: hypothetical protein QME40_06890 [bacterium]|nr:hypothetical protein [bacterium]
MGRWTVGLVFLVMAVLVLSSCATRGPIVGKQSVVETSGKKGDWINAREDYFEKKGNMYFRGLVHKAYDLALGRRQAEADAKKRITESITSLVRTEYEDYARGANMSEDDVGRFVADGIAWTSENIRISGIMPDESYWEKVEASTYEGVEYFYNCYVLVKMSKTDYNRTRSRAIDGLIEKARAEKNKLAEEAAMELKRKLEKGEIQ